MDSFQDEFLFAKEELDLEELKSKNDYLRQKYAKINELTEDQIAALTARSNNIITTMSTINMVGWKHDPTQ